MRGKTEEQRKKGREKRRRRRERRRQKVWNVIVTVTARYGDPGSCNFIQVGRFLHMLSSGEEILNLKGPFHEIFGVLL